MTVSRKYRGKYPNRIRSVSSVRNKADTASAVVVITNAGEREVFHARDLAHEMPRCGVDLDWYRAVVCYVQAARAFADLVGSTSKSRHHLNNAKEHVWALADEEGAYDFDATVCALQSIARDWAEAAYVAPIEPAESLDLSEAINAGPWFQVYTNSQGHAYLCERGLFDEFENAQLNTGRLNRENAATGGDKYSVRRDLDGVFIHPDTWASFYGFEQAVLNALCLEHGWTPVKTDDNGTPVEPEPTPAKPRVPKPRVLKVSLSVRANWRRDAAYGRSADAIVFTGQPNVTVFTDQPNVTEAFANTSAWQALDACDALGFDTEDYRCALAAGAMADRVLVDLFEKQKIRADWAQALKAVKRGLDWNTWLQALEVGAEHTPPLFDPASPPAPSGIAGGIPADLATDHAQQRLVSERARVLNPETAIYPEMAQAITALLSYAVESEPGKPDAATMRGAGAPESWIAVVEHAHAVLARIAAR